MRASASLLSGARAGMLSEDVASNALYVAFIEACIHMPEFRDLEDALRIGEKPDESWVDREFNVVYRAVEVGANDLLDAYEDAAVELPEFMDWFRYMEGVADAR